MATRKKKTGHKPGRKKGRKKGTSSVKAQLSHVVKSLQTIIKKV